MVEIDTQQSSHASLKARKFGGQEEKNSSSTEEFPFTLSDLKKAIPPHCFKRSNLRSFLYLFGDLSAAAVVLFIGLWFNSIQGMPLIWKLIFWPIQWAIQGFICTGLWVIAHECGHRAFSESDLINDTVGLIVHSGLLVPYHSWRISHSKHHQFTNSMEDDQVFVPQTRNELGVPKPEGKVEVKKYHDDFETEILSLGVLFTALHALRMLLIGWPAYLLLNVTGKTYNDSTSIVNHFNPFSPIFAPKDRPLIVLSDVALVVVFGILGYIGTTFGLDALVKFYLIPYFCVNFWLVFITFLQHTDVDVPHYTKGTWTWLKGALCTVDRDYGFLNFFFHHIGDTHVCHHLFSKIPHYHAEEASKHLIPILGKYYRKDDTNIFVAMYRVYSKCLFVDGDEGILYYQDK